MDNAAKALLIAGGILISIIVLSLFMLMLNSLTDYQLAQTQIERNQDVVSFNNQFASYLRDGISGSDIVSLINKVTFYNRTKSSIGDNSDYVYEKMVLEIDLKDNKTLFAMDGRTNKLFGDIIEIDGKESTTSDTVRGFDKIEEILNTNMPEYPSNPSAPDIFPDPYRTRNVKGNIKYTEEILQGLLDNYNSSESIFDEQFETSSLSEKDRRKRFSNFNIIVGKVFFPLLNKDNKPISDTTIKKWWRNYFSEDYTTKKYDGRNMTIRDELAYYYEYKQFQRGVFNYVAPTGSIKTYSEETGRIIYMKFKFTGEFI